MRPDIVPGATFPDYELPDQTETMRKLSELQRDDPLLLTLARGHYCPKEHQQHLQLAAFSRRSRSRTHRSPRSRPTTTTRPRSSAPVGPARSGPSFRPERICPEADSTSRSTPTRSTT
jgi:hypothetical protein